MFPRFFNHRRVLGIETAVSGCFSMFVAIRRTSRCLSLLFRTVVVIISEHRYTFLIGTLVYVVSVLIIIALHTRVTHVLLNTTQYIC